MLNRYLGNKTGLLGPILEVIAEHTPPGGRVGDFFAGTLSVSLALKEAGYDVVANDLNHFSCTTGRAFLVPNAVPAVDLDLIPPHALGAARALGGAWCDAVARQPGFAYVTAPTHRDAARDLATWLAWLQAASVQDLPADHRRSDIHDAYTEAGERSAFTSRRGAAGRRRFFSPDNGRRLDAILCVLRHHHRAGHLSAELLALSSAVLCRAAERVANTQGTWHDFPRDWIDPRALRPLTLELPALDATLTGGRHVVGDGEDSILFALRSPRLHTLYLDPPYNFRQYTAYYFLPNVLTLYPHLPDPDAFFADLSFVRGQNMSTDHASSFCSKADFLDSLGELIRRTPTDTVVLSYFNGRNHWNDFKQDPSDVGREHLEAFFRGELFTPDSLTVRPIPRKNYQSYKGFKGQDLHEYLFTARKAVTA